MLEDDREDDDLLAPDPVDEEIRVVDPVLRAALRHLVREVHVRVGFPYLDVETGIAVIAPLLRDIVAGELELMPPFQLQRHLLQGGGRGEGARRQRRQRQDGAQPEPAARVGAADMEDDHRLKLNPSRGLAPVTGKAGRSARPGWSREYQ